MTDKFIEHMDTTIKSVEAEYQRTGDDVYYQRLTSLRHSVGVYMYMKETGQLVSEPLQPVRCGKCENFVHFISDTSLCWGHCWKGEYYPDGEKKTTTVHEAGTCSSGIRKNG